MALDALTDANQDRPFADLVMPLVPAAQRLAYGMLQNAEDSEDAVQEATFKAWRAFPRLGEGSNHRVRRRCLHSFATMVRNHAAGRHEARHCPPVLPGPGI
jgi:DNA-directed RNA polymerase specialized sigma24 family protein